MMEGVRILAGLLNYDPETGEFVWRRREGGNREEAAFNTKYAGKLAGGLVDGYRRISYKHVPYAAHQIAWFIVHGEIPPGIEIDHENGVKSDNRIGNLRLADTMLNARNRPVRSDNRSGFQGVYETKFGTWYAQECVNGRNKHLGTFPTYEEAVAARLVSQAAIGFHPNHGRKAA